jgi:hypothetical protein
MTKFAPVINLLKNTSTNRGFWDNATTIVGTVVVYLAANNISIPQVVEAATGMTADEWSQIAYYLILWLLCFVTGKKVDIKELTNEKPILLTDRVDDDFVGMRDSTPRREGGGS